MSRPQTYADILLHLPVDDTLKTFLEGHALPMPEDWAWSDSVQTSRRLIGLIQAHPVVAILKAQQVLKPDREYEQPQAVAASLFE